MRISLQKTFLNKNSIRFTALLIGFLLWSIISSNHLSTITINVPVCFYNSTDSTSKIEAPEHLSVTLKSSKIALRSIDFKNLAVHIDCNKLTHGTNEIKLSNKNLFLPDRVKLVNYSPINFAIKTKVNT